MTAGSPHDNRRVAPVPLANVAQLLTDVIDGAIRALGPALDELGRRVTQGFDDLNDALPANWHNLTIPQILAVMDLMRDTGWSLLWTPPTAVLTEILEAPDRTAQGALLLRHEALILHGLDELGPQVANPDHREFREAIAEAIEVYRSGYFAAAQALATVTLTTAMHRIYGRNLGTIKQRFRAADPLADGLAELRLSAVKRAVALTLVSYNAGDAIPPAYNRHASTHGAGIIQYSQLNSLTSVMLVVSLLVESHAVGLGRTASTSHSKGRTLAVGSSLRS